MVIEGYTLVEKIGEGGFGVVYRAKQNRPIQREVAVKIPKLGMDTEQVVSRFQAERQAAYAADAPGRRPQIELADPARQIAEVVLREVQRCCHG